MKLQLGEKFPTAALYCRAKALGIGLMKPRTIIAAMEIRLYVGNMRANSPTSKIIKALQNNDMIILGENNSNAYTHTIKDTSYNSWTQQIGVILQTRAIKLLNHLTEQITENKTIMNYANIYARIMQLPTNAIDNINHVRL